MSQLNPIGYAGYNLYYAGLKSKLGITGATVVKSTPTVVATVTVITAGSTEGAIYDSNSTENSAANQIFAIPADAADGTVYVLNFPCAVGLAVTPGTAGTLAISFT